ncbi:MAG: DNA repair protein RecN [Candidatus Liberibacter ctenarytainae]|uniref:DNA repair protein RecN n=1 Tax=Candidatus Liberibacter ctenarytainae TaxID=2020335 RepID=A0A937AQL0_9HYPH|nr:DNA repair protein RecN [Candidatus Liberibacter ctenarytainae]
MLINLSIRNIALIESIDIDFFSGLSILSGETGSGKSILLDSLFLAIGGRGDGGLVRRHAEKGQVTATFDVPDLRIFKDLLEEANITPEDCLILRRIQFPDGKTKAYINDQRVSVHLMRSVGSLLVEIHGQHADRSLIDVSGHRRMLDSYAEIEDDLHHLGVLYQNWRKSADALQEYKMKKKASSQDIDFLRFSIEELQSLTVNNGEESELSEMRSRILKQERISTDLGGMIEQFNKSSSPIATVSSMLRRMERKSLELPDLLEPSIVLLSEALENLSHAQQEMEKVFSEIRYDVQALNNIEERLFALRAMSRKYSVPVDQLADIEKKMVEDLANICAGNEKMDILEQDLLESKQAYDAIAQNISAKRHQFAQLLERNVMAELPALKLENVRFMVTITSDIKHMSSEGIDRIEFYVQTNMGENPGPLMKLASGGELSRLLLALKIVLIDRISAITMVFDEVDTGIGGAVADAIGCRLKQLSTKNQLLVITHSPQVASRADTHFLIYKENKSEGSERMITDISVLVQQERYEEIARMLAGRHITEEARAAAKSLLECRND